MSYLGGGESLSEVLARNRAAICPTPGCGRVGVAKGRCAIIYNPGGGVALDTVEAALFLCPTCAILFARTEKG